MDIYQAIKKDHDEVKHMLEEQIEEAKSGSGQDMMEKIVSELSAREIGEEFENEKKRLMERSRKK